MEKKRYKMHKKGKSWLIAPIVFFGLVGASGLAQEQVTYAEEVAAITEAPTETTTSAIEQEKPTSSTEEPQQETTVPQEKPTPETAVGESEQKPLPTENEEHETTTETPPSSESDSTTVPFEESSSTDTQEVKPTDPEPVKEPTVLSEEKPANPKPSITPEKPKKPGAPRERDKVDPIIKQQPRISIYRVYNPNSGEHLHTMNSYEKDYLVSLGWRYEGVSMVVTTTGRELFRIYNPNSGEHHYTLNSHEIAMLKKVGWRYEGIAWRTPWSGIPMYRVYNPNAKGAGGHHYTMSLGERNFLLRKGWRNEGISWHTLGSKSRQEILRDWFYARQGRVTYSMTHRHGPKSYDCSSAVFYALIEAGYLRQGTWIGNTDTLFSFEGRLFKAISRKDVRRGDLFIAGKKGNSGGAFGHTGLATSNSRIIHCNYQDNGISETLIHNRTGNPCYWFRFI